ncbi:alpha-rhamnosidase [Paenibacillus mesophilus]|uniref:alpha-L-rhamnosidase-related protein n=1 Tax=Paenibacillus mesophilus TaxID=2582849 RepID=UPI00192E46D0|nr:alpha-rhamnosidase [Paenibacillus mesophilus]
MMKSVGHDEATWIWYPGDFEIWLHREVVLRREERGNVYPPFYRVDSPYCVVKFQCIYEIVEKEELALTVEGRYNVMIDGRMVPSGGGKLMLPKGKHSLVISVVNESGLPALFTKGNTIASNTSWRVTSGNWNWIVPGCGQFHSAEERPSGYRLPSVRKEHSEATTLNDGTLLVDFGKETFGYVQLHGLQGEGTVMLYYGESLEEALSEAKCDTLDRIEVTSGASPDYTHGLSRAFRYVRVIPDPGVTVGGVSMLYEYLPVEYRGQFRCSNERINRIWDVAAHTMHLTTREFFLDGIKRDRWVWSGDASQSYLINYYSFFDEAVNRRTMIALRGKDPIETHLNTILDYSFYWIISLYDHYWYTGDLEFIRSLYPKMLDLIAFCRSRANERGMVEGKPGDWVFVDWADISKEGELSFQQVLFARSLEVAAEFARMFGDDATAEELGDHAAALRRELFDTFWDEERGGLLHNRINGRLQPHMTRYANMFALLLGFLDAGRQRSVASNVLMNDQVPKIATPYMRFYELAALCEIGEHAYVASEMERYWGGMLDRGATSFWEVYDPEVQGSAQYAMYGRPFGKSLCHAWGAGPIYLLGKYFMGVKPLEAGYARFLIEPHLGGLAWFEGTVPANRDNIRIYMDETRITVRTGASPGILRITSRIVPSCPTGNFHVIGQDRYELALDNPDADYDITYANSESGSTGT